MFLAFALSALTAAPQEAASGAIERWPGLNTLIASSEQIVVAQVVALHGVPRPVPRRGWPGSTRASRERGEAKLGSPLQLIELRVENVVWGEPGTTSLFVFDDPTLVSRLAHGAPAIGDRAYWFLQSWTSPEDEDPKTLARLQSIAGASGIHVIASGALGKLPIECDGSTACWPTSVFSLPASLIAVDTHTLVRGGWTWSRVLRADLDARFRAALDELVPSVHVELHTNGPYGTPTVDIDRGGRMRAHDPYRLGSAEFGADEWNELLAVAERLHFRDIPHTVGHSCGPCDGGISISIRTWRGGRKFWILGPSDPRFDDEDARLTHERARLILDAIPIARAWYRPCR